MTTAIVPIAEEHAAGFHACLDAVAREKRYLAQVEALPLERVAAFVKDSVKDNAAQYVALEGGTVVGWCDIFPDWASAVAHCGGLGMGVLAAYRGPRSGCTSASASHTRAASATGCASTA